MKCDVCGNDYDKAMTIEVGGKRGTYDSFECAIHALAEFQGMRGGFNKARRIGWARYLHPRPHLAQHRRGDLSQEA